MITSELYDLVHAGNVKGVVEWLQKRPEDLNGNVSEGYTPLHVACMFSHEPLVRYLVERGALVNVDSDNAQKATPLHLAVSSHDERLCDVIARVLIANGAELNARQAGGLTPLHHAVARGSSRLVETLIEAGADPHLKDDLGRSPMDLAKDVAEGPEAGSIREALKRAHSLPLEV